MKTPDFVRESNRIEGIEREPTVREVEEHDRFMELEDITVEQMERFVSVYEPGAMLRVREGMNVRIGRHVPLFGGPHIQGRLETILEDASSMIVASPYEIHVQYEKLHPFTDGNGRSGRVLWAWMMNRMQGGYPLGFLHHFYYQALDASR